MSVYSSYSPFQSPRHKLCHLVVDFFDTFSFAQLCSYVLVFLYGGRPSGISLCIVGPSGAGKTALTAKLADSLYQWQQALPASAEDAEALRNRPVKIVFCGSSANSLNALDILINVCRQISLVLDTSPEDSSDDEESVAARIAQKDYRFFVRHFQYLVRAYPMVIFFESLDQLSDQNQARSELSFLKGIRPHRLSRIIVSTLPDISSTGVNLY